MYCGDLQTEPGGLRNLSVICTWAGLAGWFVSRNCNTVEGCATHRGVVVMRPLARVTIGGGGW